MINKEMKTLSFGDITYEIVDEKARKDIESYKSEGENSFIANDGAVAIGDYSFASGKDIIAGCRGYYIKAIDFTNTPNRIYLTDTETIPISVITTLENPNPDFITPAYEVGDEFKVIGGGKAHWIPCGTIKAITNDIIEFDGEITNHNFTASNIETTRSYVFSVPGKPYVGYNDIVTSYTTAFGAGNVASGDYSFTEGYENISAGDYSHTEGRGNIAGFAAHAEGLLTKALGIRSHAECSETQALEGYSHAEGHRTIADGIAAHAEGAFGQATADYTHVEGYDTRATAGYAHAEGNISKATKDAAHAEGFNSEASGKYSHSEGSDSKAKGEASHAENLSTEAIGKYTHSEGFKSKAIGDASHSEGFITKSLGSYSHTEGYRVGARGTASHGEGWGNTNIPDSIVNGTTTSTNDIEELWDNAQFALANADGSHVEGRDGLAQDKYSHVEGFKNISHGMATHVQGRYNVKDTTIDASGYSKYAHIVGNGTSDANRSNAHTLDWVGNAWFAGNIEGTALILKSSTKGSTKRFKITIDDSGTLSATEVIE